MHQSADFHLRAQAERHVRECEERIARQLAYVRDVEMHQDLPVAEQARRLLVTMQHSLELARHDLAHSTLNRRSTALREVAEPQPLRGNASNFARCVFAKTT